MSGKGNLSNQSTENAFAIFEYLIRQPEPLKLLEIAERMHMNASTVSRYLTALQTCGYVEQNPKTYCYSATTKICELANLYMDRFSISQVSHPFVQDVSDYFGETACFSIERNSLVFYIDIVVSSSRTLMNMQRIGSSAPLHSTAAGKLFLTNYSEAQLESFLDKNPLARFTDKTITSREELLAELDRIRKNGYSIDNEENEDGIKCIAYPIRNRNGKIISCISVTGPAFRLSSGWTEDKQQYLANAARQISNELYKVERFNI